MRALAADLRAVPDRELGGLPFISWRVSGQRCQDSARFLRGRLPDAVALSWEELRCSFPDTSNWLVGSFLMLSRPSFKEARK